MANSDTPGPAISSKIRVPARFYLVNRLFSYNTPVPMQTLLGKAGLFIL
jgi:hypothetical protein